MTKKLKLMAPKNQIDSLSAEAQALHSRLKKEWRIADAAGGLALLTLCQCLDRLREAQTVLLRDGIIALDRFGQPRAHPASTIEREARAGMLACLKSLGLDLATLEASE